MANKKMSRYQVRDLMKEWLIDKMIQEFEDSARQSDATNVKHWATELVRITHTIDIVEIEDEYIKYLRATTSFNDELYKKMMQTFYID